jgi:Flp pilus assembly protein TadG
MLVDRHTPNFHPHREGVAAVELAVCLPVIVVLVFAAIESCSMIYITQALHCATYEGVRAAVLPTADNNQVLQRTQQILDGHGIKRTTITVVPSDVSNANPGELVRVRVQTSCDANRISPSFFFRGRNIEVQTTMVKE